jgi:3-dehydroquinate synthase
MRLEQAIHVTFRYTIHFTRDLFDRHNRILADLLSGRRPKVALFVDSGLEHARPQIREEITGWFGANEDTIEIRSLVVIQGGEKCKNDPKYYQQVVQVLRDSGLDRHSYAIIVGGAAVLDAVGFAASIVHGGIRPVRVPTTVLAQSGAGADVMTGINLLGVKNLASTFAPPWAVINDFNFLRTLPRRDWIAGLSEAFKVAIVKDRGFLSFLTTRSEALRDGQASAMEQTILRCAELHAAHVRNSGNPFETGTARPLDFGQWSAHWLETLTEYELRHGEAAAVGIALDLMIAKNRGLIGAEEHEAVTRVMNATGLPLWHPVLKCRDEKGALSIYRGLEEFRQYLGGDLTLVMPKGLGSSCQIADLSDREIERAVEELEGFSALAARESENQPSSHAPS